ncbi:MAG: mannose-1-phosphate guanylyltransferase [Hyphomicrobiales bacterium]|nr:MAG: mannose-1-phosphate guanylyltransferase [Hyphomicrobiales bacterium]
MENIETLNKNPKNAMILAAGLGTRMRPITDTIPKPLVKVYGKTLLDHSLDVVERAGVEHAVVNVHHHADQMESHLAARHSPDIAISDERDALMNSGGGIAKALPKLGKNPFFLLNSDTFWIEGCTPNLKRMSDFWDADKMDILLMLSNVAHAIGYTNKGDFTMDADGHLTRRIERTTAPFAYAGAAIINPAIFDNAPDGAFSLNVQFDEAIEKDRLFGMNMDGLWLHVGTPEAIRDAEEAIARSAA